MNRSSNKTGIILAGGKSSRMGAEKGLVVFNNKSLIQYAIDTLKPLCGEILISSSSSAYDQMDFHVISDLIPDSGPMIGIYSCLLASKTNDNLVLSCDMPFVTGQIFDSLENNGKAVSICVPWYDNDHYEPLCGLYRKAALNDFEKLILKKNYKLPDLFKETSFRALKITDILPPLPEHYFVNINSQNDLLRAEKLSLG